MPYLEKMTPHRITGANYVTSVNGMLHPDRILKEHDFLYMLNGTWEIFEEDTPYEMRNDDLLILSAGKHHFGATPCNPGNRHMYIHALPTAKEQELAQSCHDSPDTELHQQFPGSPGTELSHRFLGSSDAQMENMENVFRCPTILHCRRNPKIRHYFHEIITSQWQGTSERQNRLSLLFSLLLCELAELQALPGPSAEPDPMVESVIEQLHTTPQIFFSAREIASEHFICERTLNNRFLRFCGKSFYAFQMETHLEMARQFLLSQPQAKLHEAALNYGFYDEFHLSKAFKKKFGMSPSAYRKQPTATDRMAGSAAEYR